MKKTDRSKSSNNHIKIDPTVRDRLIVEHTPLVRYIVNEVVVRLPLCVKADELISSGVIGLIDATKKFNPSRNIKFKTYATIRIKGAILDELRALDWMPRQVKMIVNNIEMAYRQLEQQFGQPAQDIEVAQFLKISINKFHQILELISYSMISLDILLEYKETEQGAYMHFADPRYIDDLEMISFSSTRDFIDQTIENLPKKGQQVIRLYYYDKMTMYEIADFMNLTQPRISQIHTNSIIRLRTELRSLKEN